MPDITLTYIILEDAYYTAVDLRETVKRLRPGYRLAGIAEETAKAVRLIRSEEPDLLIADTSASDGDSISLLLQAGVNTPVIFISEYALLAERARSLNMAGFILKPVTSADLQRAFAGLDAMRENSKRQQPIITTT